MKKTLQTIAALLLVATAATAQSVFNMPKLGQQPQNNGMQKKTAAIVESNQKAADLITATADEQALQQYRDSHEGRQPAARMSAPAKSQNADPTLYRFRGQNTYAGKADDGTTQICGMVGFNLQDAAGNWAWSHDTIAANEDMSPYSFQTPSYFYSYRPVTSGSSMSAVITKFDKRTLQQVGEKWTVAMSDQSGIPYRGICYDPVNRQVYAISMGNTVNNVQPYYLNIADTISGQMRRVGEICHYNGYDAQKNINPGELFTIGGQLYGVLRNGGYQTLWVVRVNPLDATWTFVGGLEGTKVGVYGQPMCYDPEAGVFYLNYYDFEQGTVYFSIRPEDILNPKGGMIATTRLMNAPTGFNWFYVDPDQIAQTKKQLTDVSDLQITTDDDGYLLTLKLTTPATLTDGTTPQGTLGIRLYIDNVETELFDLPASVGYGQELEMMADVTPGLHTVRLQMEPSDSGIETLTAAEMKVCGKDVPAAVGNLRISLNTQNVATITWAAPTQGRYKDFGGVYEGGTLTYRVVRDNDGMVLADGVTSRRVQDTTLPEEMAFYTYTVTALLNGREGAPATTDQISVGTYMGMPYENDLESINQTLGWTIINANNDGTLATWQWNTYSHQFYGKNGSNNGRNDDWLISPPFRMQKGHVYEFRAKLSGRSNLDFWLGTSQTVNGMTKLIAQLNPDHLMTDEIYSVYVEPDQDGTYYFGLHDYVFGEYIWLVDDIYVNEWTVTGAPAAATGVVYQAADKGQLNATVSLTAPATDINGETLGELSAVKVYDVASGALIGENTSVQPGQPVSVNVSARQGFNYVRVVAENAEGLGWPVQQRAFAGVDVPVMADARMFWSEEDEGSVTLRYHVADRGVNGGYVDTDHVTYTIYQYFNTYPNYQAVASEITDTEIDVEMIDPTRTGQAQYILAVTATSVQGESDYKRVGVVLGKPFTLPYVEEFGQQGLHHAPYISYTSSDGMTGWAVDQGYYNANVSAQNNDGIDLVLLNNGTADGKASFCTPIIDFRQAANPMFHLWIYDKEGVAKGGYVTIDAITNGADFEACSDTVFLGQGNGWREASFSLKSVAGKRAQVIVTGYMPTPDARIWIDNWRIAEAEGNDLAVTTISRPFAPKNGQLAEVEVAVSNLGAESASDYSVMFTLNGEVIAETEGTKTLEPGQTELLSFPLNISSTMDEIIYSAELLYDDDNQDNNLSAEVELTPEQIELPAPTDLTMNYELSTMNWTAPETTDGREVMLDFEDQPVFSIAPEINGWLNIDGDQHPTTYFLMYYGTYWPYVGLPQPFMTWNAAESGNPTAAGWRQHQGERCLICFGHYDLSDDGYEIDDDDDWFISPEVKGGTSFSFWTLSNGSGSTLEVRASTTDRQPASFTQVLQSINFTTTQTWQKVTLNLPANAKYVALHIPYNLFGIMVDEIQYTAAQAPQLLGYNVYNGTQLVGTVAEPTAQASQNGTYRVTALYDLGESVPTNAVAFTNGVESVAVPQQQPQQVFDLQGRRLSTTRKGLNIVKTADATRKVIVK